MSRCSRTSCARKRRRRRSADAVDVAATLRNLADRLSEYCGEGTYAYLLDRETTVLSDARLVVFDTRRCPDSELRTVMFSIMEYVTTTVERHWKAHKDAASRPGAPLFQGRSIMLIDEAWHLISRAETGEYANNLARRARHLGLVLIVMSQQLSDFDTDYGVALLGNCSQQMLLSQNPKEIPFIAETLQLSEREARRAGAAEDSQGSARADAVAKRHAGTWQGGTQGRADRVLGVHLRSGRGGDARGRDQEARRQRVGGDRDTRETRHARTPRPSARDGTRPGDSAGRGRRMSATREPARHGPRTAQSQTPDRRRRRARRHRTRQQR